MGPTVGRCVNGTPRYILNSEEGLFGYYPVQRHTVTAFHFTVDEDDHTIGTPFVEESKARFNSVWSILSREYTR